MSHPRMFCFPNDQAILIRHTSKTTQNGPYIGRQHGTLVLQQFLRQYIKAPRQVRNEIRWGHWSQEALNVFIRWLYTQEMKGLDGELPSDSCLFSSALTAGRFRVKGLHNDTLDALDASYCSKECTRSWLTHWNFWRRPSERDHHTFWRRRRAYFLTRLSGERLDDLPQDLALEISQHTPLVSGGPKQPFAALSMRRFHLGRQPADREINSPNECGQVERVILKSDRKFQFGNLPAELRTQIYKFTLLAQAPLKPGGPTFRWKHDNVVDTSILRTCHWVYQEARPIFRENKFQIHALYGEELAHIVGSIGTELTINWYPEVVWQSNVLASLVANRSLKRLNLNFYPGSSLLNYYPSTFGTWYFFSAKGDASDSALGEENLVYIANTAPFLEKFLGLPGFWKILLLRGLERVTCKFHHGIPSKALTADDKAKFQTYVNDTLTQPRTTGTTMAAVGERWIRWVVDG